MFHDGDLQSGIALALSQSKLLACFVTGPHASIYLLWHGWLMRMVKPDGAQESSLWEEDYLQDDTVYACAHCSTKTWLIQAFGQINPLLSSKAVLLRVESGSQEAGYLSAFCAVSTVPTLVVIQYVFGPYQKSYVMLSRLAFIIYQCS